MANGEQMKLAIESATVKVAKKGYDSREVTTKDVLLAGFGYLVTVVEESKEIRIRFYGRVWVPVLISLGAISVGAVQGIVQILVS